MCEHGFIGACAICDGCGQNPEKDETDHIGQNGTATIGKTYMVHDGAGFTAFLVVSMGNGKVMGYLAEDTDGEDVLTYRTSEIDSSELMEEMGGVCWNLGSGAQ